MSVEAPPKPIPNPDYRPPESRPDYNAAADPNLRNDLDTDVAVKMTEQDYIDAGYWTDVAPADTSELLPADHPAPEQFQYQPPSPDVPHIEGKMSKVRAHTSGLAGGIVRSLRRGEDYDPTKHNRVVQKAMYKNVGSVAVREHLVAHDAKRFDKYAEGKTTKTERVGAILRDAAAVAPVLGLMALGNIGRALARKSEPEAMGKHLGGAMEAQSRKVIDSLDRNKVREAARKRSQNVGSAVANAKEDARKRAVSA